MLGADVSSEQGDIDWPRVGRWRSPEGEALGFVVVKATEGAFWTDRKLVQNAAGVDALGLIRGFYHFGHPAMSDAPTQAHHFYSTACAQGFRHSLEFLALDIEEARRMAPGPTFAAWVLTFLDVVTRLSGQRPFIYTGGPFFDAETAGASPNVRAALASFPLWLAAYVKDPSRYLPHPWDDWTIHQRSGDVAAPGESILRVDGIATNVDRDIFRGSPDDLRIVIANTVVPSDWSISDAHTELECLRLGSA